ncbi:hypothetical protein Dimus_018836 [Dionaea muscipula]
MIARLAFILGVPGKNGIYEYIKDVWEESKYTKPLEITRRFANNETLTAARRVKFGEMKPFQRFVHFLVMKNVIPRFGKRDTSSFMDLTYMDHLMAKRIMNCLMEIGLPWYLKNSGVPPVDKKGEEQKRYDYFEETCLTICKLTRENGVWWVRTWRKRRRDDVVNAPSDEQFYDAQVDVEEPVTETPAAPEVVAQASAQ